MPLVKRIHPETAQYYTPEQNDDVFYKKITKFTGKDAFFISRERAELTIKQQLLFMQKRKYRLTKNCPIPLMMAIELQPRSPYRRMFDKLLFIAVQAGLSVNRMFIKN